MKEKILNKYSKKSEKGITLVSLIVTIIILFILSATIISISTDEYEKTKLKGFNLKLEIAQEGIEKIARTNESYKDAGGNIIYLKNTGEAITSEHEQLITSLGYSVDNFSYFTSEKLETELNIYGVDLDLLINFEDEVVISVQGIESDGNIYYTLEDDKYRV